MSLAHKKNIPYLQKTSFLLLSFLCISAFSSTLFADVSVGKQLFSRGSSRGTLYGGTGVASNQTYFVAGLGYGYYILNGLQLGLDVEAWVGNSPDIYKVTPQLLYVYATDGRFFPYGGVFYRRSYYSGMSDLNSAGGRAGLYTMVGPRVYAGFGMVYEQYLDCSTTLYTSCSSTYPEVNISVGF